MSTREIAVLIVGMAIGIGVHRLIMAIVLEQAPDTIDSYKKWMAKEKRHRKK